MPRPRLPVTPPPLSRPSLSRLSLSRLSLRRHHEGRRRAPRHGAPRPRSVERRRARALLLAAVVFAAVVLLSALPWSTLVNQHTQLASSSSEVNELQAENRALGVQARELSNASTQAGLARQEYGLVEPGEKAYEILPASGTATPAITGGGHVPLDEPPVVPGSRRSEELLGAAAVSSTAVTSREPATTGDVVHHGPGPSTGATPATDTLGARSFWSRVAHSLEFWS
jgi:cell division protein FtsB